MIEMMPRNMRFMTIGVPLILQYPKLPSSILFHVLFASGCVSDHYPSITYLEMFNASIIRVNWLMYPLSEPCLLLRIFMIANICSKGQKIFCLCFQYDHTKRFRRTVLHEVQSGPERTAPFQRQIAYWSACLSVKLQVY